MKSKVGSIIASIGVGLFFTVLWFMSSQTIREETGGNLVILIITLLVCGGFMGYGTYIMIQHYLKKN